MGRKSSSHRERIYWEGSIETKARSGDTQIEVRETLRKIQSTKTHKQLIDLRRELNDSFEMGAKRIDTAVPEAAPELSEALSSAPMEAVEEVKFAQGVWVRVPKWKNVGEIIEWDGKKAALPSVFNKQPVLEKLS